MSPAKKRGMIRRDHPELDISQQCRLVRLSRSAFYSTPVGIDATTLALMKQIDRVFTKFPFFGSRQIAAYLRRDGIIAGRHRVRRLMATLSGHCIRNALPGSGWGWRRSTSGPEPANRTRSTRSMRIC